MKSTIRSQRGDYIKRDTERTCSLCQSDNHPMDIGQGGGRGMVPHAPTLWSYLVPLMAELNRQLEGEELNDADPMVSLPEHWAGRLVYGSRETNERHLACGPKGLHSLPVIIWCCTKRMHSSEEGEGERDEGERGKERRKKSNNRSRKTNRRLHSQEVCPCRRLWQRQEEPDLRRGESGKASWRRGIWIETWKAGRNQPGKRVEKGIYKSLKVNRGS